MRLTKSDPTGTYSYLTDGVSPASPVLSDGYSTFTPGISEINGSGSRFYLADAQGNSRGLLDGSQNNPDGYNWDAFGNSVSRIGTNPTAYAWNEESGYQSDNDSGLKLLGHRYYDSRTGRFISQDPAGDGDNWYAYADNDPTDEVDPDGLMSAPTGGGMWGVNGGTQSDGNWAMGNVEGDLASARNTWAQVLQLYLYRATDHHDGKGYQVDGEWPLWNSGGMGGAMIAGNPKGGSSDLIQTIKDSWFRVERGSWKQTVGSGASKVKGVWMRNKLHFHLDPIKGSKELMKYHLPYQWNSWWNNLKGIGKRNLNSVGNWAGKWLTKGNGAGLESLEDEAE